MPHVNRSLVKTLRKLHPFDGTEDFMPRVYAQESPVEGLACKRLLNDMADLERLGMIRVFRHDGRIQWFTITSDGRDYYWNRAYELACAMGRGLGQLFIGAFGGMLAALITCLAAM
ncbi:hypothetical protein E4J93_00940 [Collinsella sp. BA40]|uniref:hypothetical protein n=1 Tax=Collinsella sp. BA40 TaxID=2560852 RepID=UPI0011CCB2C8|nr:hypothetical protein [Collinsella sp. BA40]TXF39048.1 hypothetical protein E4J93_00940 [Collinsella sp. BA40]